MHNKEEQSPTGGEDELEAIFKMFKLEQWLDTSMVGLGEKTLREFLQEPIAQERQKNKELEGDNKLYQDGLAENDETITELESKIQELEIQVLGCEAQSEKDRVTIQELQAELDKRG